MKLFKFFGLLIFISILNSCTPESLSEELNRNKDSRIDNIRADTGDQYKEDESRGDD